MCSHTPCRRDDTDADHGYMDGVVMITLTDFIEKRSALKHELRASVRYIH